MNYTYERTASSPLAIPSIDTFRRELAHYTDMLESRQRRSPNPDRADMIKDLIELYRKVNEIQIRFEKGHETGPGKLANDKGPNRDEPTDEEIYALTGVKVAATAPATWTKLRDGSWGIRCTSEMKSGDRCLVQKRDGTRTTVKLGRLVWSGNGVWLFSIKTSTGGDRPYECEECGEWVRPGTECWETGMSH